MLENADWNSIFSLFVGRMESTFHASNEPLHPSVLSKIEKESTLALKTSHPSNAEKERLVPCSQEESKCSLISEVQGSKEQGCCTASTEFRGLGRASVKEFWKAIKLLNRQETSIPPLADNNQKWYGKPGNMHDS